MRIFLTGATGALGQSLVPMLVAHGHQVTGTTTTDKKVEGLRAMGAEPVVLDVLDADAVLRAVEQARPEVVVHQATAIAGADFRKIAEGFAVTNRLRSEGTDNLIRAARKAGARRVVAQSFAPWAFARVGGPVKTEDDPLDTDPPDDVRGINEAIRHLEEAVSTAEGLEGVVLRYGGFYGPGTGMWEGGEQLELVRKRKFPIVGGGEGVWSLVHIEDAASATVAAIEGGAPGVYNVADDEPAPVKEWLPVLAEAVGAKPPRKVPAWIGRLAAGEPAVVMMTDLRGVSNAKAKRELGWRPKYPSWREGFAELSA